MKKVNVLKHSVSTFHLPAVRPLAFASRSRLVINGDFLWPCELLAPLFMQRNLSITQIHQSRSINIASVAKSLA